MTFDWLKSPFLEPGCGSCQQWLSWDGEKIAFLRVLKAHGPRWISQINGEFARTSLTMNQPINQLINIYQLCLTSLLSSLTTDELQLSHQLVHPLGCSRISWLICLGLSACWMRWPLQRLMMVRSYKGWWIAALKKWLEWINLKRLVKLWLRKDG